MKRLFFITLAIFSVAFFLSSCEKKSEKKEERFLLKKEKKWEIPSDWVEVKGVTIFEAYAPKGKVPIEGNVFGGDVAPIICDILANADTSLRLDTVTGYDFCLKKRRSSFSQK